MARNKAFNVHDLYPADYCFNYQAFCNNPEAYVFTPEDIAYINVMELGRYGREVPMAYYEKTLLRKWAMSGHSPRETPPSRYLCLTGSEPYDFLDIHRMDKEIRRDMRGMSKAGQKACLMEYMGWTDDGPSAEETGLTEPAEWDIDHQFDL
jgi:hypothetical protein